MGDGQQAAPFWNELPDNMRGTTAEETLQKLMPSWKGYHQAHTTREPALEKGKPFDFEITDEKVKPHFDAKSPMAAAFTEAAAELGLTKKQANGVAAMVMGKLVEGGHMADSFNPVENVKAIAGILGHKEINDAAKQAVQDFETQGTAWAQNLSKQWGLSETAGVELESLMLTPGGVELVRAMQGKMGQPGMAMGGQASANGVMTAEKLHDMGRDASLDPYSPSYDKAKRAAYDQAWTDFYSKK
jgi:hypothetical protein